MTRLTPSPSDMSRAFAPENGLRLSVIIPAFNRELLVRDAIRSVADAGEHLATQRPELADDWELIVVDDGSTDGTLASIREAVAAHGLGARTTVLTGPNLGPGPARNRGAREARGRYLAFLDSDDRWFAWTLARVCEVLESDLAPKITFNRLVEVDVGAPLPGAEPGAMDLVVCTDFLGAASKGITLGSGNAVVEADLFRSLGGFTKDTVYNEDLDFFLRAGDSGPVVLAKAPPMIARGLGESSLTRNIGLLISGLDFVIEQERRGAYRAGRREAAARTRLFAIDAVWIAGAALAAGNTVSALRLIARNGWRIVRGGAGRSLLRVLYRHTRSRLRFGRRS
jgi:glycosyltransferase involved in cell wall biosynthesis